MMLVNNPGSWDHIYAPLEHANWNGWTFTDCVFPFFLFISGMSMALSLTRLAQGGTPKSAQWRKLSERGALVVLIGLGLHLAPEFDFQHLRVPGVLQRIGLCIVVGAPLLIYASVRQVLAAVVALYALYSVLLLAVPVPDLHGVVAAGVLEPGRDFGAFVDRYLLDGHLWNQSRTWDPEGLAGTLSAVGNLLLGGLAGRWIGQERPRAELTVGLLLAGLVGLWLGTALDGVLMPINKSLWTVSYSIFTTGWALLVFGTFYWLLDAQPNAQQRARVARWSLPLVIYGMNALFLYALSFFLEKLLFLLHWPLGVASAPSLGDVLYAPIAALPLGPVNTSLLHAILFDLCMFAVAWWMWRKRWFVKV